MKTLSIRDSEQTGYVNMAVDICLMRLVENGEADAVFRTYRWSPHCLSIGRLQKAEHEADIDRLVGDGYHIVRRPTGGRAVWHGHELTYSLVCRLDNPLVSGPITESIGKVAQILVSALQKAGVPAVLNERSRELSSSGRRFNPCFTSHGKSEIMTPDGRKLVGSAQARSNGVFLEHGSIIFSNQQTKAVDYLPETASTEQKEKMRAILLRGVGTVLEYNPSLTTGMLAENLHEQFSRQSASDPVSTLSGSLPGLEKAIEERRRIVANR